LLRRPVEEKLETCGEWSLEFYMYRPFAKRNVKERMMAGMKRKCRGTVSSLG
jgi:hypothetical protein